ncbi:chromosome segregation protein SMC [Fibrobacterota bacterium]
MYLSKLRIFGFKSFSSRVEVNFPLNGITSVVGPNGCGKSNIVDAIRWVLGEQKVKALRSSKMEDVIFSGTAHKPAMNMAEVSLIIENDKGVLPGDHTHVMITRQAYRNGDSAYLINNQPCRLKDIQHLFYDTGMGATSYSLIEASMIDRILSDKDDERRVLFEEASGISKYKKYREETRRQLERTSLDLARVEDNLKFTRHNVNMFERQARKAEKHKDLMNRVKSLELSFNADRYEELRKQLDSASGELACSRHTVQELKTSIATKETQLEKEKLLILEHEKRLSALNQTVANLQADGARYANDMRIAQERINYMNESLSRKEKDLGVTLEKIAGYGEEKKGLKRELDEQFRALIDVNNVLEGQEKEQSRLQAEHETVTSRSIELSEKRLRAFEDISAIRNELGKQKAEHSLMKAQREETGVLHGRLLSEESELQGEKVKLEESHKLLDSSLRQNNLDLECKQMAQKQAIESLYEQKEELREIENEKVALETKCGLLKKQRESREGMDVGTRYLLNNEQERIKGVLLDLISVPEEYIGLVELCSGESLQTLILENGQTALELVQLLKVNRNGAASMYAAGGGNGYRRERPCLSDDSGFKGWLVDKISADQAVHGLVEFLLGQFALVDDMTTAERLSSQCRSSDFWFVTPGGDMIHSSGMLKAGLKADEADGLLLQKAQLTKAEERLNTASSMFNDKKDVVDRKHEHLENLTQEIHDLQQRIKIADIEFRDASGKLAVVQSSLSALEKDKQENLGKQNQTDLRLKEMERLIQPVEERLQEHEAMFQDLESELAEASSAAGRVEREKTLHEARLRESETLLTRLQSRIDKANAALGHLDSAEREQSSFQIKMDLEGQEWESNIAKNQEKISLLTEKTHELNIKLQEEKELRDQAKTVYDSNVLALDEIRGQINRINAELHKYSETAHKQEMEIEHTSSGMGNIRDRMFEVYEVDLDSPDEDFDEAAYDASTVENDIAELKEKLKRLGNVNISAMDDYEQEKSKLEDVKKQFEDLEKARAGLKRAIRKLDKVACEQFQETFSQIQENFQNVFSTLFEGGQARLCLEEDADPLDARIEINGSPSGKRMRGVTLLSGGERALTAISLLFALYLVRPSPYCIMDEVDGPLDDANIGRFINMLRRFSQDTQFIVVTHNKRTMAASDTLYGVTQEIKGISQLVSVKLDEASLIAA